MGTVRVGVLASLSKGTGNQATAERIARFLEEGGYQCLLVDLEHFRREQDFLSWEREQSEPIQVWLGIHAWRAGRFLISGGIERTYSIVYGGTDLNEYPSEASKLELMKRVCAQARFLVCFSTEMSEKASEVGSTSILVAVFLWVALAVRR